MQVSIGVRAYSYKGINRGLSRELMRESIRESLRELIRELIRDLPSLDTKYIYIYILMVPVCKDSY
jgi:hypothetical protein